MTTDKTEKKKTVKKPADKPAKKPAAKKAAGAKKASAKKAKKAAVEGVRHASADSRSSQEEGSIAPPTTQLVDAFAKFRQMAKTQRRPAPPPPKPAAPAPAPGGAAAGPLPQAGGAVPAKTPLPLKSVAGAPAAVPAAPPVQAPTPAAPGVPGAHPAAKPAVPVKPVAGAPAAAPTAPPAQAPKPAAPKPGTTEPRATYRLDTPARPGPAAPPRPGAAPAKPAAKPPAPAHPGPTHAAPKAPHHPAPAHKPAAAPKAAPAAKPAKPAETQPPALKPLEVSTLITVRELAEKMSMKPNELIKKLMMQGVFATINQRLDSETAIIVASEFGYDLKVKALHMEEEISSSAQEDTPQDLKPRPPVVTVMGHVDHGKTKLLDAIRQTDVAAGEAGGITQHIGAYRVATDKGDIVFLDTPGHEAFTAMRSRGARATDIVILVVSAADGVQPQTVEAIDHAKEAKVPILVAVNKIDLPGADPQRVRQDLSKHGLLPEEWGGKTIFVDISAKMKRNIDKLLEMVLLQAEMLELKANPDRVASGVVIEAKLDTKRGAVATVLVQKGTIRIGDPFVMGLSGGKVRALVTDKGDRIKEAGPSTPVEIMGLSGNMPQAGDTFTVVESERTAKEIIEKRNRIHREEALAHKQHVSLLNVKAGVRKELPVILKADVQGSVEVLKDSLEKLSTSDITVRVIHSGLGNANESDVLLASASDAVVLLFHVQADSRAKETAEKAGVEIWQYDIIYDLTADVKASLEGLLEPEEVEVTCGRVMVLDEFKVRNNRIAGCQVLEGKAVRGARVKFFRGKELLGEGRIETLKRLKDDVASVEKSSSDEKSQCGMTLSGFAGWQKTDQMEVLVKEKRVRRLEGSS
ncbi:MAG: translation initiation factor IF-2 [Elusimicrobiota bacterium]